ncbi:MAG: Flp family type IVb pilin [Actinobacteria bacterium]|jgi:Flp pilus assembly pilin Flp|nr:MAG: Flp family type IVb pilin [Actinomycetota bacterium]
MLLLQTKIHGAYLALRDRLERQEGQALVEYALILALIAVLSIAILQALGVNVSRIFNKVNTQLSAVAP